MTPESPVPRGDRRRYASGRANVKEVWMLRKTGVVFFVVVLAHTQRLLLVQSRSA
jgi:hypothetical protein